MKKSETLLNICFGLSLIYWGVAGYISETTNQEISIIRIFITILNITVGTLILTRKPILSKGSLFTILISLPSLICGGLLFKLTNPLESWSISSEILFVSGGTITIISFLFLGRNFSIFPGVRSIVSNGFYNIIRHPSYLGESFMVIACFIESKNYFSLFPFLVFIPSILIRIKEEEKLLNTTISYWEYKSKVKWRLLPYIW